MQDQFVAVKAIIEHEGKILLIRETPGAGRANPGKWDVPGGRVEFLEDPILALKREAREEVGLDIDVGRPIWINDWRPVIGGAERQIVGMYLHCTVHATDIHLNEEHDQYQWVTLEEAKGLPLIGGLLDALEAFHEGR
jgi:8-oxo-dGTP diphosphatase